MGKRNKIRYTASPKEKRTIIMTGTVFLQFEDEDEDILAANKGDVLLYPENKTLQTTKQGDYRSRGYAGYFKVDIFDGKHWKPIQLNTLFPDREHYFGKSDHPIDVFTRCGEILVEHAGTTLIQTYREHYIIADGNESDSEEE